MNVAKAHKKSHGLREFYVYAEVAYKIVLKGVTKGGIDHSESIALRDQLSAMLGRLITLESELERLDIESPCIKCEKIKEI